MKLRRQQPYPFHGEIGLLELGRVTEFLLDIFYIMGSNSKNARNGKSASKISKWLRLRPLEVKSEFIRNFESRKI